MFRRAVFLLSVFIVCSAFFNIFSSGWSRHVPQEFKSTKVIYKVDGTHFFGPGGINDAFIVYKLSDDVVNRIKTEGLIYLQNMPSTKKYYQLKKKYNEDVKNLKLLSKEERRIRFKYWDDVRGKYGNWNVTPVLDEDEKWVKVRRHNGKEKKGLSPQEAWDKYKNMNGKTYCLNTSVCSFYGDFKSVPYYFKKKNKSLKDLNFTDEISSDYIELINEIITTPGSYYGYGKYGAFIISPEYKKMFLLYRN